ASRRRGARPVSRGWKVLGSGFGRRSENRQGDGATLLPRRRQPQFLTRPDTVRIAPQDRVQLQDFAEALALSELLDGYRPQRLAGLDRVDLHRRLDNGLLAVGLRLLSRSTIVGGFGFGRFRRGIGGVACDTAGNARRGSHFLVL